MASFPVTARRLTHAEMPAAARLCRAAYDARLPWLAGRHSAAEDAAFFAGTVFAAGPVWGAFGGDALLGIAALRVGEIDQLYVAPEAQSRGVGSLLIDIAKASAEALTLWVFARNAGARRFYEARGFVAVEENDGSRNEEREPDVRYAWRRGAADLPRETFGDGPPLADPLLALVLAGIKTATCWDARDGLRGAAVGARWVALDAAGTARALLETVELTGRRFDAVDAAFAFDEGEGDRSLAAWRDGHRECFEARGHFAPDMALWCERFRLVATL